MCIYSVLIPKAVLINLKRIRNSSEILRIFAIKLYIHIYY